MTNQSDPGSTPAQSAQSDETSQELLASEIEELTRIAKQAMADLANFKRRTEEEKKQFIQFATSQLLLELLTVTDTFDRALKSTPPELETNEWIKGIRNIDMQFHKILEKQGVQPIDSIGQKLDIQKHEALMSGPGEKDTVIEEFERGYMLNERTLRPAKVKVGNGEAQPPA